MVADLAVDHNVVVLVPSHSQAVLWAAEARATVSTMDDISALVSRLKAGHVGLVVIVNRYDGFDLPGEACRILVIDGVLQAHTGIERREATAPRHSRAMTSRHIQRIEQGMGRGVGSRDDRCAVVVMVEPDADGLSVLHRSAGPRQAWAEARRTHVPDIRKGCRADGCCRRYPASGQSPAPCRAASRHVVRRLRSPGLLLYPAHFRLARAVVTTPTLGRGYLAPPLRLLTTDDASPTRLPREGTTMDMTSCPECGAIAEVQWRDVLESTDGPVEHAKIQCLNRHWFLLPVASLVRPATTPRSRPATTWSAHARQG